MNPAPVDRCTDFISVVISLAAILTSLHIWFDFEKYNSLFCPFGFCRNFFQFDYIYGHLKSSGLIHFLIYTIFLLLFSIKTSLCWNS